MGETEQRQQRNTVPLLSIYSLKFGSLKTNIEIKQDCSAQS